MSDDTLLEIGAFARDLVVQAGAGTGKTHALVTLYLHLVTGLHHRGEVLSPSEIVVITFTDKAAGELRERIASRMEVLYEQGLAVEPSLQAMATRLGRGSSRETVRAALAALHRAPIGTFHATGHAMLKRHALEVGLDPSFVLLDGVEQQARELEAARTAVLAALEADDAAVEQLVDAQGFGGRERAGLLERLATLRAARADEGRDAQGIASAYETGRVEEELQAARRELRSALRAFGELGDLVKAKSADKARELAGFADAAELEDLTSTTEMIRAIREQMKNLAPAGKRFDELRPIRQRLDTAIDALGDAGASVAAAPRARAVEQLLGDIERRYTAAKRADSVVDFADLIRLPRDLLRDRPAVRAEERARVSALLVDEFQDTNRVQAELVALLAGDPIADGGRSFYVGDRKQSIYEFRGADVAVFTEATSTLVSAGAGELFLRTSYRSTPKVVQSGNALFARAFGAPVRPEAWALSFDVARDGLLAHRDEVVDGGAQLLRCGNDDEKLAAGEQRRREARAIAAHMSEALRAGRRPGHLALLLRRYTHLQTYLHALRLAQIPHYVVQGRGFYATQEIRDVASLLMLLEDARDRFALAAVLRSPLCGISDDGLASLVAEDQLDLRQLLSGAGAPLSDVDREALARWSSRLASLQEIAGAVAPSVMVRQVVDAFDLAVVLAGTAGGQQKIANLEHLIARTATLEAEPRSGVADLPGFTRWLSRAVRPHATREGADAQIVDERDDVVRVMTIHQSKGLQFPVVFVADCGARERALEGALYYDAAEGLGIKIPGEKAGSNLHTTASRRVAAAKQARQRAESMRLFYVAATRAQDRVVFSGERRSRTETSWRSELDAFAVAHPDLLTLIDAANASRTVIESAPRTPSTVDVETLAAWQPLQPQGARTLRVAVTQLADFASCARRFHLLHELRVPAPQRVRGSRMDVQLDDLQPDALTRRERDPLRRGVLAHLLLERCTFGLDDEAIDEELRRLLREEGYDENDSGPAEVASHVRAFLRGEFARSLGARAVRRELPFVLPLAGAVGSVRVLSGQLDLAVLDRDGVSVIDYKHAKRSDLAPYRFQLEAYALAVAGLYPRAPRHRVGLVFLRDEIPEPVWVDHEPLPILARRLADLMEQLAQAKLRNQRSPVARDLCRAMDCAYQPMCHPEPGA